MASYGSTTIKSRKHERGLEPDECYWIQNEPLVRGMEKLDLSRTPPPDLAIEIDITNSSLDRLSIYATLGVPEVWRYDGQALTIHILSDQRDYRVSPSSRILPFLSPDRVSDFINLRESYSETDIVRQFRAWVRERIAADWR